MAVLDAATLAERQLEHILSSKEDVEFFNNI